MAPCSCEIHDGLSGTEEVYLIVLQVSPVCIIQPVLYTYPFINPSLTLYDPSN